MQNEIQYEYHRKKQNHVLKRDEKEHYTDIPNSNKSNLKENFEIMKGITYKNRSNNNW